MKHHRSPRRLRLEALETRTLLAADLFGLEADLIEVSHALSGSGYNVSFEPRFGNQQLILRGTGSGQITVDAATLPDFVDILRIEGMDTVTILGERTMDRVLLSDVGILDASGLVLTGGVFAESVDEIRLQAAGIYAVVKGDGATLLDVQNLDGTLVLADVDALRIDSASDRLNLVSFRSRTTIELLTKPAVLVVSGIADPASQVYLPGEHPPISNPGEPGPAEPPATPSPGKDDDIIVVTLPVEEQLRQFLARIRAFMNQSRLNEELQIVLDLADAAPASTESAASAVLFAPPEDDSGAFGTADTPRPSFWFVEESQLNHGLEAANTPMLGDLALEWAAPADIEYTDRDGDYPNPVVWTPIGATGDQTHDAALGGIRVQEHAPAETVAPENEAALLVVNLDEMLPTAADYIVQRVTAEFLPGQRNGVLLTSPRSSRPASAAEQEQDFASFV